MFKCKHPKPIDLYPRKTLSELQQTRNEQIERVLRSAARLVRDEPRDNKQFLWWMEILKRGVADLDRVDEKISKLNLTL